MIRPNIASLGCLLFFTLRFTSAANAQLVNDADVAPTSAPVVNADAVEPTSGAPILQVYAPYPGADPNLAKSPPARRYSTTQTTAERAPRNRIDQMVDQAIDATRNRMLVAEYPDKYRGRYREHTPWQIAHGILALRDEYEIAVDGKRTNAIEYMARNPIYRGTPWYEKTRWGGKGTPFTEPYEFEGHPNQFLAFYATAGLPEDFRIGRGDDSFTLGEWVRNAQMEMNDREEITWTLWAFAVYLDTDARWVDQYNRGWSLEKLVRMQMDKHPTKSACGGMHGLFAIAEALKKYDSEGHRFRRGIWLEADQHVKKYVAEIKSMQNKDGSFSSNYLKGPEWSREVDKRVSTTGHTLEFLMNALPDSELNSPWVMNAVQRLSYDLVRYKSMALEPGGMYHACDALVIYRERTRPAFKKARPEPAIAEAPADEKSASKPNATEAPTKVAANPATKQPVTEKPAERKPTTDVARPTVPQTTKNPETADPRPSQFDPSSEPNRLPPPPAESRPIQPLKPLPSEDASARKEPIPVPNETADAGGLDELPKPAPVKSGPREPGVEATSGDPTRVVTPPVPAPATFSAGDAKASSRPEAPAPSRPAPVESPSNGDVKRTSGVPDDEDAPSPEVVTADDQD